MDQVLLLGRSERIVCHIAGLWINLFIVFMVILFAGNVRYMVSLESSAFVFLTMLIMNLLPILNTDGQKLLTTILDIERP